MFCRIMGVTGNQGCGKTTACEHVAKIAPEITFKPLNISEIVKDMNFEELTDFTDFTSRLAVQIKIADELRLLIMNYQLDKDRTRYLVIDRTFADIYVYTLTQLDEKAAKELVDNPTVSHRLEGFLQELVDWQEELFDVAIFVEDVKVWDANETAKVWNTNEKPKLRGSLEPNYLAKINIIQNHFHFLTSDSTFGCASCFVSAESIVSMIMGQATN
jgi:hypothetical protein